MIQGRVSWYNKTVQAKNCRLPAGMGTRLQHHGLVCSVRVWTGGWALPGASGHAAPSPWRLANAAGPPPNLALLPESRPS